jgi:hypothetical protein
MGYLMRNGAQKNAYELLQTNYQIRKLQKEWIAYWNHYELDLVVAPGFGSQAQPHRTSKVAMLSAAYTFIWNVLEMASGAMPITVVREDEQYYKTIYDDLISRAL